MLDIGGWEFLVVAFVLLMVVGPRDLPKMLRGFTGAIRHVRKMASEFTRSLEDLADENDLGDLKGTIANVKRGDLSVIADTIDPKGELKESVKDIKSNSGLETASGELAELKEAGDNASYQVSDEFASPHVKSTTKSKKKQKS
jgi:sec-independent protein translocase protein TatB